MPSSYACFFISMIIILLTPILLILCGIGYYLYLFIADAIEAKRANKEVTAD